MTLPLMTHTDHGLVQLIYIIARSDLGDLIRRNFRYVSIWWRETMNSKLIKALTIGAIAVGVATMAHAQQSGTAGQSVYQATFAEPNQKTPEVSTEEVRSILADGSGILIDARKYSEYAAGHIAGAKSVPSSPPDAAVATVGRLVGGDRSKVLVLYCNGLHCVQSRDLSEQLVAAGFTNVRRYQLGIPMWRALNGPVEIELEGILRVYKFDQTAVFFDGRSEEEFSKQSLPGTHNMPLNKIATLIASRKPPLPINDFNTRIILFGRDAAQARALADAMGNTPYQNVSYLSGTFEELAAAARTH